MYNEFQNIIKPAANESDECLSRGICSISPTSTALQEVILLSLKELSFYILKLKEFGMANEAIKKTILAALFNIVTNAEYNQEQFKNILSKLDEDISQSKALYEEHCRKNNIETTRVKTYFKHSKTFDLTEAIKKGEKYFLKKTNSFTIQQKNLFDIMLFLVKSVCIKIIETQSLGKEHDEAYYAVLSILDVMNLTEVSEEKIKDEIIKIIEIYHDIVRFVFLTQVELYGEIEEVDVPFSIEPGKAILVSGSDLRKLELVLKAVENTEINVYTHGIEMLMAHAFPKLRSHLNLKGHYGAGLESSLIDFATFPGAILMTKFTLQRVEYLFRGRLYTLDPIAPMGVVRINENNFEQLIRSALNATGFAHAHPKPPVKVGFSETEINKKIDDIVDRMLTGEIKHLYIVGLINLPHSNKSYFEKFFELLPKDCFAISLCHPINKENVFHLESFYDYSLVYKILKEITSKLPLNKLNMSIFLTKCDKHTISNLLYLKHAGVKNVFMCQCPPTLVNPALMETLQDTFGIKEFNDPAADIKETLKYND